MKTKAGETMIIITGANGQLGRAVALQLIQHLPASQVGVSVREPEKAEELEKLGITVRHGDFQDPASLRQSFEGASQVLLVSVNAIGEAARRQHRNAIEAAVAVGAERMVYTSQMGASPTSLFAAMPDHAEAESALQACGVPFTSLRNGFYASSALLLMGSFESGEFATPADGPVAWTTHSDLVAATVSILTGQANFEGPTPPLTGSQALTMDDLAALASEAAGRKIKHHTVSNEQYRANLISHGAPEHLAEMLLGGFAAFRKGEFSTVDPTLEKLLGRPPVTMREVLAERLSK